MALWTEETLPPRPHQPTVARAEGQGHFLTSLPFSCSFLLLQLHQPLWGRPVAQLPRGLRQPPPLRLAHPGPAGEPYPPGLQRHRRGASVRLPGHQGWGHR